MLEFVKPMRKSIKVSEGFAELLGKELTSQNTRGFVRSVMEPAWLFVIIHMA